MAKVLKKILSGSSIAGLLTTILCTPGCSDRKEIKEELGEQKTSQQQPFIIDNALDRTTEPSEPSGKETKIRGKSG